MRKIEIVLLVLAGALAGAVVMKLAQHPKRMAATPAVTSPAAPVQTASSESQPATSEPNPQPVAVADAQPSQPVQAAPPTIGPVPAPAVKESTAAKESTRPAVHSTPRRPAPVKRAAVAARALHKPPRPVDLEPSPAAAPATAISAQNSPSAPPAPSAPLPGGEPAQTPPARPETEDVTPPSMVPSAPEPIQATLNAGMLIPVRLLDSLSSDRNRPGDIFAATLDHELVASGYVIAERGARVEGRVTAADHNARTLSIELTSVHTSDNQDVPIQTERFDKQSEPDRSNAAAKIGAGAVIGAVIGGIAGGGKGAAIGAGAGGGAGAGDVMLSRKGASLASETRITFRLRAPVTITERTQ
jgi:hypothetical protein